MLKKVAYLVGYGKEISESEVQIERLDVLITIPANKKIRRNKHS